jgi:hypothetical protein
MKHCSSMEKTCQMGFLASDCSRLGARACFRRRGSRQRQPAPACAAPDIPTAAIPAPNSNFNVNPTLRPQCPLTPCASFPARVAHCLPARRCVSGHSTRFCCEPLPPPLGPTWEIDACAKPTIRSACFLSSCESGQAFTREKYPPTLGCIFRFDMYNHKHHVGSSY